ncbi:MAG: NADH-quinone oxidoreductase subunit L [Planctomycetota bacterium]
MTTSTIPLLILVPFLGAMLNAFFGRRFGKSFVTCIGVSAPLIAFVMGAALFGDLRQRDGMTIVQLDADLQRQVAEQFGASARYELVTVHGAHGSSERQVLRVEEPYEGFVSYALANRLITEGELETEHGADAVIARAGDVDPAALTFELGNWFRVGGFEVNFAFLLDRISILLVLVITGIGSLIHIYSTGYMGDRPAGTFARFFTYLNLFVAAMLVLVLGKDLLLMFVGWEGVGMCSYLLIGFDYGDKGNAACGTKAFVVNRIGDLGFVLGMLCLVVLGRQAALSGVGGDVFSLDVEFLRTLVGHGAEHGAAAAHGAHGGGTSMIGVACLLLFIGATGKSAQIPLHIWLPDAMAGPTPVSALIHAATMVTAGIYMITRLSFLFEHAEVFGVPVLGIVAVIGGLTAFCAGAAAIAQDDIKRVLAYSTVSQLGYMFLGVGAAAYGAAVFHLVTHAFFKALLFLGAGSVIHACHSQSMSKMGGLREYMPWTHKTMMIGGFALAGFPLLSGFFSKDLILFHVLARSNMEGAHWLWPLLYGMGVFTAALTALYSMRLLRLTFYGSYRGSGHPHESPWVMTVPLQILALGAILASLLGWPKLFMWSGIEGYAELLPHSLHAVVAGSPVDRMLEEPKHWLEILGLGIGTLVAVGFCVLGFFVLWNLPPSEIAWERPVGWMRRLREFLFRAWMYDEVVNKQGAQPAVKQLSYSLWRWFDDKTLDQGLVDGMGRVGVELSHMTRAAQSGRVSSYLRWFAMGAVVLPLLAILASPLFSLLTAWFAGGGTH